MTWGISSTLSWLNAIGLSFEKTCMGAILFIFLFHPALKSHILTQDFGIVGKLKKGWGGELSENLSRWSRFCELDGLSLSLLPALPNLVKVRVKELRGHDVAVKKICFTLQAGLP